MSENISLVRLMPAKAERIYGAWLSAEEHGKMVGAAATIMPDGTFTAWDGYISGRTLEKVPFSKIVQAWRTTEFPDDAPDSTLTIHLEATSGGTRLTLTHENLPDGQGEGYRAGWEEHYFQPMTAYFTSMGEKLREAGAAVEEAAERAGDMLEQAVEDASESVEAAAKQAVRAMGAARTKAKKQALQAVKGVKRAQKKAVAGAKKLGKKVKALVSKKAKKPKAPAQKSKRAPAKKKKKR